MKNKGYTLIEIIISFALMSVIALVTLTLFSSTYLNIVHFGDLSHIVTENQTTLEWLLSGKSDIDVEAGQTITPTEGAQIKFTFNGTTESDDIYVPGFYYQVEKERSTLETFVFGQ